MYVLATGQDKRVLSYFFSDIQSIKVTIRHIIFRISEQIFFPAERKIDLPVQFRLRAYLAGFRYFRHFREYKARLLPIGRHHGKETIDTALIVRRRMTFFEKLILAVDKY